MMRGVLAAALLAASMTSGAAVSGPKSTILSFSDLAGWKKDDHAAALAVFANTCPDLKDKDWASLCALATSSPEPRQFFEMFFRPVLIEDGAPALFTGYFEPELNGARNPGGAFRYPIYSLPPELEVASLWYSRSQIEDSGVLSGRGLEIAWVDDPVDVFFLQIQGSGRIRLQDGSVIRVGYAGANGHPYRSIGEELVRLGIFQAHQVSAQVIRNWVRRNPEAGADLLRHNPSFVFFRQLSGLDESAGPLGAMNRSITPLRSIAVDPAYVPLGAPVWIEKGGRGRMNRLMIAQDTGSAIKGAQRADIFFGPGNKAGRAAGRLRDPGRMVVLLPIQRAFALVDGANL